MGKWKLISLLLALCMLLGGCSESREVENQAYALVLGVDRDPADGMIELTIQIPKIGSPSGSGSVAESGGSKSGSPYLVVSAKGSNYFQALESLEWSVTRELNLSQMKLLIVSEEFARDPEFASTISQVADTYHLYTAAHFVVCDGSAKQFISGQETIIGTRLSTEIVAMFEHYVIHGYIPNITFADTYYALNSFYSDPMAIWGFSSAQSTSTETGIKEAATLIDPEGEPGNLVDSPSSRHYLGAMVFRNGVMAEKLDGKHMLFTNLILGDLSTFNYDYEDETYQMTLLGKPKYRVDIDGDQVSIRVSVQLSSIAQSNSDEELNFETSIEQDILETIQYCQDRGIEPFGFAEKAARKFLTIQDWLAFDWHARFSSAAIDVDVHTIHADS